MSLKLPIVFFQITTIGLKLSSIINITMLIVFIIGATLSEKLIGKTVLNEIEQKAINYHKEN